MFMLNENSPANSLPSRRQGIVLSLPIKHYHEVWDLQRDLLTARAENGRPDTLILVEHPPVYTMGRRTQSEHWGGEEDSFNKLGFDLVEVERGGSVTYHGPGQIVGYPILRLRDFCPGPRAYVGKLEEVIIRVLNEWGIQGQQVEQWRGVWVKDSQKIVYKIAAIGVRITRGITMHGFALNINVDLKPFDLITPCGIEGCQVTSMAGWLGKPVDMSIVREQITHHFSEVFGIQWTEPTTE